MSYSTDPFNHMDGVLNRVVHNMQKINTSDGDSTTAEFVAQAAMPIRPDNIIGTTITVLDGDDDNEIERRPNNMGRITFGYSLVVWVIEEDPVLLPQKLRRACDDVWRRHHSDEHLSTADSDLGGSGAQQLVSHRILTVRREYSIPDGVAVFDIEGEHDFLVT